MIVQFGGQTPLHLAVPLERAGVPIIGTSPDAIDRAEDRERFEAVLEKLGLARPPSGHGAQRRRGARRSRSGSATRCWCGRPTCSAAAPWRSCTTIEALRQLHARRGEGVARAPGAGRPLPRGRDRGRRRRDLRRRARRDRRHHGAHRGGGHPLGRQRLLAAAVLAARRPSSTRSRARRARWRSSSACAA